LIDSDVVDDQLGRGPFLGEIGGQCVGLGSEKVSSDGNVDQEEEGLVEGLSDGIVRVLSLSRPKVSGQRLSGHDLVVDQELDLVLGPDGREEVEIGSEIFVEIHGSTSRVSIVGPFSSVVKCVRDLVGLLASSFHDIDFSRGSPSSVNVVSGEHPEGRPEVISLGQLGSHFEFSVLPCSRVLGVDSSGGVLLVGVLVVAFLFGFYVKKSVFYVNIGISGSVALQLVVLRFAVVFILPFAGVEFVAVEFVLPDELVFGSSEESKGHDEHSDQ